MANTTFPTSCTPTGSRSPIKSLIDQLKAIAAMGMNKAQRSTLNPRTRPRAAAGHQTEQGFDELLKALSLIQGQGLYRESGQAPSPPSCAGGCQKGETLPLTTMPSKPLQPRSATPRQTHRPPVVGSRLPQLADGLLLLKSSKTRTVETPVGGHSSKASQNPAALG